MESACLLMAGTSGSGNPPGAGRRPLLSGGQVAWRCLEPLRPRRGTGEALPGGGAGICGCGIIRAIHSGRAQMKQAAW